MRKNHYLSLAGAASITLDHDEVERLWNPAAAAYFDGPDDASVGVLRFEVDGGEYWDAPSGRVGSAFAALKAAVTGNPDAVGRAGPSGDVASQATATRAALTICSGSRSNTPYRSAMLPDWPNSSTPTGTTGAPKTPPSQARWWLAASWTVTIGSDRSAGASSEARWWSIVAGRRLACGRAQRARASRGTGGRGW